MRAENEAERHKMEELFRERLTHVTDEFATELMNNQEELNARHTKKLGKPFFFRFWSSLRAKIYKCHLLSISDQQYEKLVSDREEIVQNLDRQHKRKIADAETKLRFVHASASECPTNKTDKLHICVSFAHHILHPIGLHVPYL